MAMRPAVDLPQRIRNAKAGYQPLDAEQLALARQEVERAMGALERALHEHPKAQQWKQFLLWDVLEGELAAGREPDPARLRNVRQQFVTDHPGFELAPFTDLRAALGEYAVALEDAANPNARHDFETHLDALAAAVEACRTEPRQSLRAEIARHLGWLQQHRQASDVVDATRQAFSHPNVLARLPQPVAARWLSEEIKSSGPVRDVVLGSQIRGTEQTVGAVAPVLVPDERRAVVQMELTATSRARTVGVNGPVRVYQNNDVTLQGRKQIVLDRDGIRTLPAQSTANVASQLTGIDTVLQRPLVECLVLRQACRRVNRQQDQADCIAEGRQRQRLNEQLDRDVDARIAEASARLNDKFFHPLTRYDIPPRSFRAETSHTELHVSLEVAAADQLGAADEPPVVGNDPDTALIHVHASAIENYAAATVAGKTYTAQQLSDMLGNYAGNANRSNGRDAVDDVSVTLDYEKPITLRSESGSLVLTVHGRRYISRKRAYPPMNITVRYRLAVSDGTVRMTLEGDPEIVPPRFADSETKRLSGREATLRRMLLAQLDRQLPKTIALNQLADPARNTAAVSATIAKLVAENNWLTVVFR
ncbi:MAG: hypothetical protein FJ276_00015 [Planctomycetes bacterium]|nr:hypothetical protein [Planctomycetota bacterium]